MVTDRNWSEIAERGDLNNWREILSSLVTFAKPEEFTKLCGKKCVCVCCCMCNNVFIDVLGERLERVGHYERSALCYICSGNVEKFVYCWYVGVVYRA